MIEINLVPDVKQELIRAERIRSVVISLTILIGIIAVSIVVVLSIWVFVFQTLLNNHHDSTIRDESAKLAAVEDLSSSLTIQNQLDLLPVLHENKQVNARIFDVLGGINPASPNEISVSKLTINSEKKTINIEAQAVGGYSALEVFKKTILATELQFGDDKDDLEVRALAANISDGDRSYGEDASGKKVLRFALTFEFPEELFMPYLKNAEIVGPTTRVNVTDSHLGIPQSLFAPKANDSADEEGDS